MNEKSFDHAQFISDRLAEFSRDPFKFVMFAFPWGENSLRNDVGPDPWQESILKEIRDGLLDPYEAIRIAVASGHGIGKSALVSWIILWSLSTKVNTRGVVTANTEAQLRTKTWPEISKWFNLFIAKEFFTLTATALYSSDPELEKTWRIDAVPWSQNNTEAFAGLHNKGNRILLIMDEASAIADAVWEVSEGALTDSDTEIIWCAFGNPTRNVGRFRECFRKYRHRWIHRQVDSSKVKHTNKEQIKQWAEDFGIDSDFYKVRVKGEFPNTSARQFISSKFIDEARGRKINGMNFQFAPVIIGVDPAWSGDDEIVIYMRQGLFSMQLGVYRNIENDMILAGYISQFEDKYNADAVFIDLGYGTGIASAGKAMGRNWQLVSFGSSSNTQGYRNKRAEMWGLMKKWLEEGGCLPDDPVIVDEIGSPEYEVLLSGEILLESKKAMKQRGLPSPNRADALALTFAFPVVKKNRGINGRREFANKNREYDPLA